MIAYCNFRCIKKQPKLLIFTCVDLNVDGVGGEAGAKLWPDSNMIYIFVRDIYAVCIIMCSLSGSVSSWLGKLYFWIEHGNELVE